VGTHQIADKADLTQTTKTQGLKPIDSIELIGPAEAVPFLQNHLNWGFSSGWHFVG
jgi:hypothetical protein